MNFWLYNESMKKDAQPIKLLFEEKQSWPIDSFSFVDYDMNEFSKKIENGSVTKINF